jgi:hypothetical protein
VIDLIAMAASGGIATGAATAAILTRPGEDITEMAMRRAGDAGEDRVALALDRASVPAVHDITLRDYRGTHQIDHVAAAGDCLYVLETKTWRGQITGRPQMRDWFLRGLSGTEKRVYNPVLQNETHADVIRCIAQLPVRPLVILAGRATPPEGSAEVMMPLARAIMEITRAGPPSRRALASLGTLGRFKEQPRQADLASEHQRRMTKRKPTISRQLWTICGVAVLVFIGTVIARGIGG